MMRTVFLAFAVAACGTASIEATALADDPRGVQHVQLSGEQLDLIGRAWEALHASHEREAPLRDFIVTYTRVDGYPPTIAFFKPPTSIRNPDGSITIETESRYYQIVVDGNDVQISVGSAPARQF